MRMQLLDSLYQTISGLFAGNPVFQGAVGAAVTGGVLYQFKSFALSLWKLALRCFSVSITVTNEDTKMYVSVMNWLNYYNLNRSARNLELTKVNHNDDSTPRLVAQEEDTDTSKQRDSMFLSANDYYYCFYKLLPVKISFRSESLQSTKELRRTLQITFYLRGVGFLNNIKKQIEDYTDKEEEKTKFMRVTRFSNINNRFDWDYETAPITSLDTLYAPNSKIEDLKKDLSNFINSKSLYTTLGKCYKRNYIIAGPPGTGKSSLARAMAGMYRQRLSMLLTTGTDGDFVESNHRSSCGVRLIEDIDCTNICTNRKEDDNSDKSGITLSSLLNVLDGSHTRDETITIITTNSPEELDPAITRPGRADNIIELNYLNEEEADAFIVFLENILSIKTNLSFKDFEKCTYKVYNGYRPCDISEKVFEVAKNLKK